MVQFIFVITKVEIFQQKVSRAKMVRFSNKEVMPI